MSDGTVSGGDAANCNETIERLYHFMDGELTEERRLQIERHLDDCSPCVRVYGFEAELRQVIANRCRDHVPDALRRRIAAALAEEHRRQYGGDDADNVANA